ncbi:MAG: TonB-dependent receptor, partial [Pseudomonadota bacterium]
MTEKRTPRLRALLLCTVACWAGMAAQSTAQDAPNSASFLLDPIFVQFDRRNEDLQEQPRAVTVIGAEDFPLGEIEAGAALANRTPGVTFNGFGQPGTDFLKIRGVGALGYPLSASDQLVGFSIDEVPTSMFGFPPTLFDMDQVEVVRGPQGTLFGRNALAGGVNFVPNKADGSRVREFELAVGTDGYVLADLTVGDWLIEDSLAARLALHFSDYDGTIENTNVGGTLGGSSEIGGRLSLTAFTDNGWTISAMAQADDQERNNSFQIYYENPDFPVSGESKVPANTRDNRQFTLRLEREFEHFAFTSLTGWQNQELVNSPGYYDIYLFSAFTGLPEEFFIKDDPSYFRDIVEEETIISQEFRLSSLEGSEVSWVAGANFMLSDYSGLRDARDDFNTTSNGRTDVDIETRSWSVFADATLPVGDRLRLSAGLRYGYEKQEVRGEYVSNGFPG